jgi:glycosyltransferase involved in cell wall biosynthesis
VKPQTVQQSGRFPHDVIVEETASSRAAAESAAAAPRPRLLFLCQTLPFPPDGGVSIRTYNVLRLLARDFEVTALCFYRRQDRRTPAEVRESVAGLSEFGRVEAFPIPQEHSRVRLAADHLASLGSGRAYTLFAYESRRMRKRLRQLLRDERFDLVHLDSLDLSGYLPLLSGLPVVCVHHNVESDLLRRRAAGSAWPARAYLRHQARLVEREERRWCPRVALNVAVSPVDQEVLQARAPGARVIVVPNGVDTSLMAPRPARQNGIVFVGGAHWFPNLDAMRYFCDEILPLLRSRGVDPRVTWVGRTEAALRREFEERYGVYLTGYVEDVRDHLQAAACYVVPLRVGGGTRLKILDAWATGKAVVSTSVGCEGLDARDGENILVRDTPESFADGVESILHDDEMRRRIGASARRTAEETYDWEAIGRSMLPEYLALARGRAGRVAPVPATAGGPAE